VPGSFSLNQMACLLDGARIYLGLDTAITHIAAATGVLTVALYGSTDMWLWHPWDNADRGGNMLPKGYRGAFRSGSVVALQAGCEHAQCIRPACYSNGVENPCMMELTTAMVCSEIDRMMHNTVHVSPADYYDGATHVG
jgi:heptosyltransferase III